MCAEVQVDDPSFGSRLGDSPLGSHIDYPLLGDHAAYSGWRIIPRDVGNLVEQEHIGIETFL